VLVAEEMGRHTAPGPLLSTNVVAEALARAHHGDRYSNVISRLLSGAETAALAFQDGHDLWDQTGVWMEARRATDGWVVNGTKSFVLDAQTADWFLLTARTDGGITQFLVPKDRAGVEIAARTSLDLVRQVGDVTFAGVQLTPDDVVGAVDCAAGQFAHQLLTAVVLQNAETVGAIDRVLDMTLDYARDRIAFGRPIASYQALKHRFANMKMWLEACHATAHASAVAVATDAPEARELVSVAKAYIADKVPSMVQDCIQLHGGIGVTWEHDLHLYLRRVTQNAFLFGGVQHHRERIAVNIGM
jgi:alkylation response protein AidB-like acyl-CoA dehydrogenase